MDRKHLAIGLCIIVAVTFFVVFTWNKGRTTSNQSQVVTQGGTVTIIPPNNDHFVVIANLGATNSQSKTSTSVSSPKLR